MGHARSSGRRRKELERKRQAKHSNRKLSDLIGTSNEDRFERLAKLVTDVVNLLLGPATVATYSRSKHWDERDRRGDDLTCVFRSLCPDTGDVFCTVSVTYDVKTSERWASRANSYYFSEPQGNDTNRTLKRAIAVCSYRSDREIVSEMLDDFCRVGALSKRFSEMLFFRVFPPRRTA